MFIAYSQKLCAFLMTKGFKLVRVDANRENTNFNIFLFDDSLEVRKAVDEFKSKSK